MPSNGKVRLKRWFSFVLARALLRFIRMRCRKGPVNRPNHERWENIEHRTSNAESSIPAEIRCSAFEVRCWMFLWVHSPDARPKLETEATRNQHRRDTRPTQPWNNSAMVTCNVGSSCPVNNLRPARMRFNIRPYWLP